MQVTGAIGEPGRKPPPVSGTKDPERTGHHAPSQCGFGAQRRLLTHFSYGPFLDAAEGANFDDLIKENAATPSHRLLTECKPSSCRDRTTAEPCQTEQFRPRYSSLT
jgi:hypothetical protein